MDTSVTGSPELYGFEAMNKRILNLIRALPDEIERAMIIEETDTLLLAQSRTPVKTGDLRASGQLGETQISGNEIAIPITFGIDLTYAIYVHENLEAQHPNGGQAKFLESAVLDRILDKSKRVAANIKLERLL